MSMLKGIIKYFSKSGYSKTLLRKERNLAGEDEPVKALQKIGKTRFGTHWTAANALDPCLPNIRNLVVTKMIKFKVLFVSPAFHLADLTLLPEYPNSGNVYEPCIEQV
jgi:hypothetical protein